MNRGLHLRKTLESSNLHEIVQTSAVTAESPNDSTALHYKVITLMSSILYHLSIKSSSTLATIRSDSTCQNARSRLTFEQLGLQLYLSFP